MSKLFFAYEKIKKGVKIQKIKERTMIKTNIKFNMPLAIFQASSFLSLLISPVKIGIKAEERAPKIKRL